jgi:hypothetical protein
MSATVEAPEILLRHHLKKLKLPTVLREHEKLARQCATEGVDHVRYLARLIELELLDRFVGETVHRTVSRPSSPRMIDRRSSSWSAPADQMVRGTI